MTDNRVRAAENGGEIASRKQIVKPDGMPAQSAAEVAGADGEFAGAGADS